MRSKLTTLVLACGLMVAVSAPSMACSFNTQASADTQQQQTAQAQPQTTTQTQ